MNFVDEYLNKLDNDMKSESWYEKLIDWFKFKFDKIKEIYYNIYWYYKNKRTFKKVLKEWRPWDSCYQIDLFAFGLEQLKNELENGYEERRAANKKIAACEELIKQLKRDIDEENPFGMSNDDISVWSDKNEKLKAERFDEICRLMKGQNIKDFKGNVMTTEGYNEWVEWFDGSGIEGWWN